MLVLPCQLQYGCSCRCSCSCNCSCSCTHCDKQSRSTALRAAPLDRCPPTSSYKRQKQRQTSFDARQCHWASYHETPLARQIFVPVSRMHKLQAIMTKVYRAFHQSLQPNTHRAPRIRTHPLHLLSHVGAVWTVLALGLQVPLCCLPTRFTSACATCSCD